MVWARRLQVVGLASLLALAPATSAVAETPGGCPTGNDAIFGCSDGSGVTVTGTHHRVSPGGGGSNGRTGAGSGSGGSSPVFYTPAELRQMVIEACQRSLATDCFTRSASLTNPQVRAPATETETPDAPARTVTITDVARFLPAQGALHLEPAGWAVVGVPANFWVDVSGVTVSADLLGQTADVRFTPVAYRFDHGDGTSDTTDDPGDSWAALGQEELTATPTSHVFSARGDLRASVAVVYSAAYRFAGGEWMPVDGAVSASTPPQRELVVAERTALTASGDGGATRD